MEVAYERKGKEEKKVRKGNIMIKYFKPILFILLSLALISSISFAYPDKAEIISIKGDVKVLPEGRVDWIKAGIGMALREGDRLKTGPDSQCNLAFDNRRKNSVGIFENSDVIILLREKEKIEIIEASLYAKLLSMPIGSEFEVKTPTAVCGARGTGLGVKGDKLNTEAAAYENDIYVINEAGEKKGVREGFRRNIDKFGRISEEIAARAEDIEKFNSWLSNLDKILKSEARSKSTRRGLLIDNIEKSVEKTEEIVEKKGEKVVETREEKTIIQGEMSVR